MDYKEKYEQALQRAKELQENSNGMILKKWLWKVFPELRESEDERIRKALLELVHDTTGDELWVDYDVHKEDALAWLERQAEQKPAIEMKTAEESLGCTSEEYNNIVDECVFGDKPKFKVGDYVVNDYCKGKVIALTDDAYLLDTEQGIPFSYEHNAHLWTIQDAKDGDVLYSPCLRLLWIFKSKDTVYCGCNLNYNDGAFCGEGYFERPTEAIPATKEQREQLEKVITDAGYKWNKEQLKLEKI